MFDINRQNCSIDHLYNLILKTISKIKGIELVKAGGCCEQLVEKRSEKKFERQFELNFICRILI